MKNYDKFPNYKYVIGTIFIPIIIVLIPLIWNSFDKETPRYAIINAITHPDSQLVIVGKNSAANIRKPLDVEFDKLLFENAGKIIESEGEERITWIFDLSEILDTLKQDGYHNISLGFNADLSYNLKIYVSSKPPILNDSLRNNNKEPGRLSILVKPYGTIFINGSSIKEFVSQNLRVDLSEGDYDLKVTHPSLGNWVQKITINSNEVLSLIVDFNDAENKIYYFERNLMSYR